MPEEIFKTIAPLIVALLIVWLIYRIKRGVRLLVKNEIYNDFPSIKNSISCFEQRINNLNAQINVLEEKINALSGKIKLLSDKNFS